LEIKGLDIYIPPVRHLRGNLAVMTLGGAAQLAAAHCPNEQTLDPAVCSYNRL